jgi:hypothetical protein
MNKREAKTKVKMAMRGPRKTRCFRSEEEARAWVAFAAAAYEKGIAGRGLARKGTQR